MSRQVTSASLSISLSTRRSLFPFWLAQHVSAVAGLGGIDIDATSPYGQWIARRVGATRDRYVPVRSVWIPLSGVSVSRYQPLLEALSRAQPGNPPTVVVSVQPTITVRELALDFAPIRELSERWPVAIGLPPPALRGGRPHLVQLGALKRFTEEWEIDLAIDLSGAFDLTWEAEAAVARMGDRLTVLRIDATSPSRAAVGRDRVACRALHAAIDRGRRVSIALCATRIVPFPTTPRLALSSARRAADYISERSVFHVEALKEGIDHFEDSPSSRGY